MVILPSFVTNNYLLRQFCARTFLSLTRKTLFAPNQAGNLGKPPSQYCAWRNSPAKYIILVPKTQFSIGWSPDFVNHQANLHEMT